MSWIPCLHEWQLSFRSLSILIPSEYNYMVKEFVWTSIWACAYNYSGRSVYGAETDRWVWFQKSWLNMCFEIRIYLKTWVRISSEAWSLVTMLVVFQMRVVPCSLGYDLDDAMYLPSPSLSMEESSMCKWRLRLGTLVFIQSNSTESFSCRFLLVDQTEYTARMGAEFGLLVVYYSRQVELIANPVTSVDVEFNRETGRGHPTLANLDRRRGEDDAGWDLLLSNYTWLENYQRCFLLVRYISKQKGTVIFVSYQRCEH